MDGVKGKTRIWPFVQVENYKPEQGNKGQDRATNGQNTKPPMDSCYALNLKQVNRLRRLAIRHLFAVIERIRSNKISGSRNILRYPPFNASVGDGRPAGDDELAGLVLAQVVDRLPPWTVHLAQRRVAEKRLHSRMRIRGEFEVGRRRAHRQNKPSPP
ncbi:hypothetical protein V2J09_003908 [Rumex salicifolius]